MMPRNRLTASSPPTADDAVLDAARRQDRELLSHAKASAKLKKPDKQTVSCPYAGCREQFRKPMQFAFHVLERHGHRPVSSKVKKEVEGSASGGSSGASKKKEANGGPSQAATNVQPGGQMDTNPQMNMMTPDGQPMAMGGLPMQQMHPGMGMQMMGHQMPGGGGMMWGYVPQQNMFYMPQGQQ